MKKLILGAIALAATSTAGVVVADIQIDPYVDKGSHYELAVTNELDQVDAVKIAKDKPEFTLEKWGGEAAITIRRAGNFGTSKRNPLSKRREIESRDGKETVLIEPVRQQLKQTDDGVKIDIRLNEKPNTNAFSFQIEGAENFDFFYQPELTPEEVAEGVSRSENVIGSYAIYHKTKRDYREGGTNYATGKAYHIYRPKVIDANGVETWAELVYGNGALLVIVPQEFLDMASYPVRVDPTIGYTTIGGTATTGAANFANWSEESASENGDITKFSVYTCQNASSYNLKAAIWDRGTLAIQAASIYGPISINSGTPQWWDVTGSGGTITSGTEYAIGYIIDGSVSSCRYFDTSSGNGGFDSNSYSSPTNLSDPLGNTTNRHSVYATYTAAGAVVGPRTPAVQFFQNDE